MDPLQQAANVSNQNALSNTSESGTITPPNSLSVSTDSTVSGSDLSSLSEGALAVFNTVAGETADLSPAAKAAAATVSFSTESSKPKPASPRTQEKIAKTIETWAGTSQKVSKPHPVTTKAVSAAPTTVASQTANKAFAVAPQLLSSAALGNRQGESKLKANKATKKLLEELEKTPQNKGKIEKLQKEVLKEAVKLSKKDPETTKEILRILGNISVSKIDSEQKEALCREIVAEMGKNPQFNTIVINFLKEYISNHVASQPGHDTLFRQTNDVPSTLITAMQNKLLQPSLSKLTTRNSQELARVHYFDRQSKSLDMAKMDPEIRQSMAALTEGMKSINPSLQELYRQLYDSVKENFGQKVADTQLASFIILKSVAPPMVLDVQAKPEIREMGKALQYLTNFVEGETTNPFKNYTETGGDLTTFAKTNRDPLLGAFTSQIKESCNIRS